MKFGFLLLGLVWFVVGWVQAYLNCFSTITCNYSSLISPLPGIFFLYMAFTKARSSDAERVLIGRL